MKKPATILFLGLLLIFVFNTCASAKENAPQSSWLTLHGGISAFSGNYEEGIGISYSIGWQKSLGMKSRFRINPNVSFGEYTSKFALDTKDQFISTTALGLNLHYDLIRIKNFSIVTTSGVYTDYIRGLMGTGGWKPRSYHGTDYFHRFYFGGFGSIGLRYVTRKGNLAFEARPFNVSIGFPESLKGSITIGVDIKL